MKVIRDYIFSPSKDLKEQIPRLNIQLDQLFNLARGRIRFGRGTDGDRGENIEGEFQVYTSNATPDTEDTIAHGLNVVPIGFIVVSKDKGGVVYKGSTAWTSSNIFLKCSTASTVITMFLLK